jgi:putative tryptophan/tyrosine transport system substrate-binding protein
MDDRNTQSSQESDAEHGLTRLQFLKTARLATGDSMKTRNAPRPLDGSRLAAHCDQSRRAFMQVAARVVASGVAVSILPGLRHLTAHAQTPAHVTRVAFLSPGPRPATDQPHPMWRAFQEGLRTLGWSESDTFINESRFAEGQFERIPEFVAEWVRRDVKAIFALGSHAAALVKRETTIPLVMIGDPVGTKLAASADRPGGTVTGLASVSQEICGKRLKLLQDVVPGLTRAALVANPGSPSHPGVVRMTQRAAEALRIELVPVDVRTEKDIESAFETMIRGGAGAFVFYPVPMEDTRVVQVAEIAVQRRLAWLDEIPRNATLGALLGYGPDYPDLARRAAGYVDKILKGASPADLPIGVPTKFELIANQKTAQGLGLTIPESVLAEATNVVR